MPEKIKVLRRVTDGVVFPYSAESYKLNPTRFTVAEKDVPTGEEMRAAALKRQEDNRLNAVTDLMATLDPTRALAVGTPAAAVETTSDPVETELEPAAGIKAMLDPEDEEKIATLHAADLQAFALEEWQVERENGELLEPFRARVLKAAKKAAKNANKG